MDDEDARMAFLSEQNQAKLREMNKIGAGIASEAMMQFQINATIQTLTFFLNLDEADVIKRFLLFCEEGMAQFLKGVDLNELRQAKARSLLTDNIQAQFRNNT